MRLHRLDHVLLCRPVQKPALQWTEERLYQGQDAVWGSRVPSHQCIGVLQETTSWCCGVETTWGEWHRWHFKLFSNLQFKKQFNWEVRHVNFSVVGDKQWAPSVCGGHQLTWPEPGTRGKLLVCRCLLLSGFEAKPLEEGELIRFLYSECVSREAAVFNVGNQILTKLMYCRSAKHKSQQLWGKRVETCNQVTAQFMSGQQEFTWGGFTHD